MAKPVLGRGLGALLSGSAVAAPSSPAPQSAASTTAAPSAKPAVAEANPIQPGDRVLRISVEKIRPCPLQPRKDFSAEAIQELADSIKAQGIVQPLVVRERAGGYELIAGERRWRAAQSIGLKEVPIIVREADDRTVLELALIENLQRENLNAIEEALGYAQLMGQFNLTQEDVATKVGKSRTQVANSVRLLKLSPEIQIHLREGRVSVGHAKVLLGLSTHVEQNQATELLLKQALTVRQTEELVTHWQQKPASTKQAGATPVARDMHVVDLENRLKERLGTRVSLRYRQGKGSIEIKFFTDDDLERILQIAGVRVD